MKAIRITTDDRISLVDIRNTYGDMSDALGGVTIEFVRPAFAAPGTVLAVDESGIPKGLAPNRCASLMYGTQYHGSPIVGDVLVLRTGTDSYGAPDYVPYPDAEAEKVKQTLTRNHPFLKENA